MHRPFGTKIDQLSDRPVVKKLLFKKKKITIIKKLKRKEIKSPLNGTKSSARCISSKLLYQFRKKNIHIKNSFLSLKNVSACYGNFVRQAEAETTVDIAKKKTKKKTGHRNSSTLSLFIINDSCVQL